MPTTGSKYPFTVFIRTPDSTPISLIRINVPQADRLRFPILAYVALPYHGVNGFPIGDTLTRINKIEEKLDHELQLLGAVKVGHVLGNNYDVVGYYCTTRPPDAIKIRFGLLKQETIPLTVRKDPNWEWYEGRLRLEPWEEEVANSWQVLVAVKKEGDNPLAERNIDVTFVFPSAETRSRFITEAAAQGFPRTPNWNSDHDGVSGEYWCDIQAYTSLQPEKLGAVLVRIRQLAETYGGDYDGWGSPVCR